MSSVPVDYILRGPAYEAFPDEMPSETPPPGYSRITMLTPPIDGWDHVEWHTISRLEDHIITEVRIGGDICKLQQGDIQFLMETLHKKLVTKGVVRIMAPYYTSLLGQTLPTKVTELTFMQWPNLFEIGSLIFYFNADWTARAEPAKEWARKHYFNVVDQMEVVIRKKEETPKSASAAKT